MENKEKSLKKNFCMNAILTMSQFIFPLITFPYVSRILLAEGTGKVSFATSIISYFAMFAQLGIPTYGIRACAQVRNDKKKLSKTAQEIFIINIIMSILAYIVFFIALCNVPRLKDEKTLLIIVSATIFFNAIGMEWLYKALEQYTYITIRSVIFKFIALIAMFLLIHQQSEFFALSCAATIYVNLDTVMLGFMKTNVDVGYYNAAVKIKTILVSIVTSLGTVLLPRASYYVEHGLKEDFYRITKKAINFVFLVATPLMLYFMFFAKEGIFFLSGNTYGGAIVPMQIIMPTLFFIGLTNIMGMQILVPLGKENIVLYSEIVGAVVDLAINYILIPKYASAGAAIGTLVAEIAVWIVQYIYLRKQIKDAYKNVRYGILILALFLGSIASLWVKKVFSGSFIVLLNSAILFFGVYFIVLTIAKEPLIYQIEEGLLTKLKKKGKK